MNTLIFLSLLVIMFNVSVALLEFTRTLKKTLSLVKEVIVSINNSK